MITHDEAIRIIELSFDEYIYLLNRRKMSTNLTIKWKNEITNYITQNEQLAKDVARYFELRDMPYLELHEKEEFYDLEEKLSKVGKK